MDLVSAAEIDAYLQRWTSRSAARKSASCEAIAAYNGDNYKGTKLARRHFEVCVFAALAAALKAGDVAVEGSDAYADYREQLLPWAEFEPAGVREGWPTESASVAGGIAGLQDRWHGAVCGVAETGVCGK